MHSNEQAALDALDEARRTRRGAGQRDLLLKSAHVYAMLAVADKIHELIYEIHEINHDHA